MFFIGNKAFVLGGFKGEGKIICICLKRNVIYN